ncbi:MerR family transcriptional regulator [Larkinella soli]|uniref:MerR family transcriptional regulator n=1 Tax=Larkinella soli TaxID=1770527 RepID=UPI000FFC173F|nr:MerR family transcriptional regulator [Larkinella soli]
MRTYSVNKLAKLAGVSVRTLHHYDRFGLLKPSIRTEARYRLYGEKELLRLQQILFYKELDFSLEEIRRVLEDPDFNLIRALESHKSALQDRRDRLSSLLETIDNTISRIKGEKTMLTDEELYAGFPKEQAEAYRQEAVEKYGAKVVEESESKLRNLTKEQWAQARQEGLDINRTLASLMHRDPTEEEVQNAVARHFAHIRLFWGNSVANGNLYEAYKGLAQLYVDDPRYTTHNGNHNPEYVQFLSRAMKHFAETRLK